MSLAAIAKELHKFKKATNPNYAEFHQKHAEFCNRFDEISLDDESTKEDALKLASDVLEAFGDQYFKLTGEE